MNPVQKNYDVVIIGGGAAGLMCALTAGQRGRKVLVLEGSNRVGKKILMSGGGRCNFTNLYCTPDKFLSGNPRFCISALSRYTQWDFIALVDRHGIDWHEKTLGQLFCDHSSKDILGLLMAECEEAGVTIHTQSAVSEISSAEGYSVVAAPGTFHCESLVIATGGLSIPKMGATDFGYRLARQFGLAVRPTRAGLVPFRFSGNVLESMQRLSGVSLPVTAQCGAISFSESMLFTHRGLSGPAMLQLSSYWREGQEISIDLAPGQNLEVLFEDARTTRPRAALTTLLSDSLPRALARELEQLIWPDCAATAIAEISKERIAVIAETLHNWTLKPAGTEGYRTAEVTLGGIDTDELSSQTMACKNVPGLYCIGEVVDVTGHLGGFNFQWAWSSGRAAGLVA